MVHLQLPRGCFIKHFAIPIVGDTKTLTPQHKLVGSHHWCWCVTQQWFCQIYIFILHINMTCCYCILPSCATNINKNCLLSIHSKRFAMESSHVVVKDPCHIRWLMWPPGRLGTAGISGPQRGETWITHSIVLSAFWTIKNDIVTYDIRDHIITQLLKKLGHCREFLSIQAARNHVKKHHTRPEVIAGGTRNLGQRRQRSVHSIS